LANIRECDAIVHVVRCFEDPDIVHVDGSVDPLRDIEVISLELVLADLEQVEKRLLKAKKDKKTSEDEVDALHLLEVTLQAGRAARLAELSWEQEKHIKGLGLLSRKPVIYAANVADSDLAKGNDMVDIVRVFAAKEGSGAVVVSAQVEAELAGSVYRLADDTASFITIKGHHARALQREPCSRASITVDELRGRIVAVVHLSIHFFV
jgi:ribosome-binding ATPase YchF (GTP1/OBG family)